MTSNIFVSFGCWNQGLCGDETKSAGWFKLGKEEAQ